MSQSRHRRQRRKLRFQRRTSPGADSGTITATPDSPLPTMHVIAYGPERIVDEAITDLDRLPRYLEDNPVTWLNVDGLGSAAVTQKIGQIFGLHSLALEDVVNVHQQAKVDPYDLHLFIATRTVEWTDNLLDAEQMSIFLGKNFVVTFQERPGDCFDPVRDRLRRNNGRVRKHGADYLAYAMIDAIIDSYFPVLDKFSDRMEELEDLVLKGQRSEVLKQIHSMRNDLLILRRAVRPHREAVNELIRDEYPFIRQETRVYLRDCYDHVVQLIDLLDIY
ncbi:MAG TPA: magnesium and cobalt transport protein CorA, partial [Pirellulaceae bacterium]